MQLVIPLLMALVPCFDGMEPAATRIDPEAVNWVKQMLKEDHQLEVARGSSEKRIDQSGNKKCSTATSITPDELAPIYVLISFSVPEATWVSLSKEIENRGGAFVLRGLPHNSFKELSKRIQRLNTLGVTAQVQINPKLFATYQVSQVPTFLIQNEEKYDKITGNVSLNFALNKASLEMEKPCAL
ncbi:MAG: type-F conjugative transfer system pilin assembly protein TrbC [Chlamydiales bacterium]